MNVAIMQPYFFPYIGYYQLAYEVEKFIFLDDVNYIKQGYINRNSILNNDVPCKFSIPVAGISSNKKINEHFYVGTFTKFLEQVEGAYRSAPCFREVFSLIEKVTSSGDLNVAKKNSLSVTLVFEYLGLDTRFSFSSMEEKDLSLKGQARIIDMCLRLNAKEYTNAIGGQDLYNKKEFEDVGLSLKFIKSNINPYKQSTNNFSPNLSMIDVLMWNDKKEIRALLNQYSIIK